MSEVTKKVKDLIKMLKDIPDDTDICIHINGELCNPFIDKRIKDGRTVLYIEANAGKKLVDKINKLED